jgi:hypothetical protein
LADRFGIWRWAIGSARHGSPNGTGEAGARLQNMRPVGTRSAIFGLRHVMG